MKTIFKRLKRFSGGERKRPEPLTLTDPTLIAEFRAISEGLRQTKPVCPVSGGGVLLLDAEDVKGAFSNKALSNEPSRFSALAAKNKDRYVAASVASNILPFLDGERHVELRKWASAAFFAQMRRFETEIPDIAAQHCDKLQGQIPKLLVEEVARDYVIDIICRFVGLSIDAPELKRYTTSLFRLFAPAADADTFNATNEGLAQARDRLQTALNQRRADGADCLLNTLDQSAPAWLSAAEKNLIIIDNALLFLADGVENVESAVAITLMSQDSGTGPITLQTVREALKQETPGQTIARIAKQNMRIGDENVSAGTPVFLSLASANDGSPAEDEFTFGRGRHKCIGENLALSTVAAFCQALAERGPVLDTSGLMYRAMFGHKWPRGVTISLTQ